jgi:tripartite-type tricarboxylate transporter receptor subunit TctC
MQRVRRHLSVLALACLGCAGVGLSSAQAQNFPSRPMTVVIPFSAGGTGDILTRAIAPALSAAFGQNLVIENRVGANGAIGEEFVARSKPDGYTIMITSTSIATNPSMMTMSYDPRKMFTPVMLVTSVPLVLVVNPQVKAQTARDFIDLARRQGGRLNYSSWGNGSIGHFAGENLQITTQSKINHIPYKSTAQALNDTLAGQVDAMFPTLPLALQHIKAGKLRALGLTSSARSPLAPEIPTMAEAGFPGNEIETWFGVFVPTGTEPAIVNRIYRTFQSVLAQPELKARLEGQGFRMIASSGDDLGKHLAAEMDLYGRLVKQANIKSD